MQPQEHRLSQEVLEFLIAHQDWFMLDITPPPVSGSGTVGAGGELDAILSSDEESWNLVGNAQPRIVRRRTTTDKRGGKLASPPSVADPQPFPRFPSARCPDGGDNKR